MNRKLLSLLMTAGVLVALFVAASWKYEGFGSVRVIANLFKDNAVLGVIAIGMTLVILSGGIDLSVGSVAACTTVIIATLVGRHHWHPLAAISVALMLGAGFGLLQGGLIQCYELPPFLVTLSGMFFARGMAFVVNKENVAISHDFYTSVQNLSIPFGADTALSAAALIFVALLVLGLLAAHLTAFGRNIYALGGSADSARLMGLPVARTRVAVYAVSGACAALAGVASTLDLGSGDPARGAGLELDAIAAVVIGGTLLSGGVGCVAGTLLGVLIFGTIQSAMNFDGRLNSAWLRIAIGALLLAFILLQRFLSRDTTDRRAP